MTEDFFLIDSSIWIWALHPDGPPAIRQRVHAILSERRGGTTPLVMLELLSGARDKKSYTALLEELSALRQFPISADIWTQSYRQAFGLRRRGVTIPNTDMLIATVAQEHHLILLHADHHFDLIASKTDLKVESWVAVVSAKRKKPSIPASS